MAKHLAAAVLLAALALSPLAVRAAQFDGKWVVDFPAVTVRDIRHGCSEMRVVAVVKDNQITATLERERDNLNEVENSTEPRAEPLTGTVGPDGSFTAQWESYVITGKLSGAGGEAQVAGSCGPRTGTAVRVEAQ
jgi:hypothetical protein